MNNLTNEEKEWIIKLQKLINECPSKKISELIIGDNNFISLKINNIIKEINS